VRNSRLILVGTVILVLLFPRILPAQIETAPPPVIGIDPDIIHRILNEPEKVSTVDAEVEKYPAFRKCRDDSGRLMFITPLLNVIKEEEFMTTAGNRFLDEDELNKEITQNMLRQGISEEQLCEDMYEKMTKVEEDPNYDYWSLMDDLVACTSACGKVLATMGSVYMATSAKKFSGLVLFNFDSGRLEPDLAGDHTQAYMKYSNVDVLAKVYNAWKSQPDSKIALDARASLPGSADYNDGLSRTRVNAVRNWFVDKGVPASRIDFKWLGKYGPPIDDVIAKDAYGIGDLYQQYEDSNAKKSQATVGERAVSIFDGLNQSVALFVYD